MKSSVAILGMSCQFPGAENLSAFWNLLVHNNCSVVPLTPTEFSGVDPAKWMSISGGLIKRSQNFDNSVFQLANEELIRMGYKQKLMLKLSWQALEDAGIKPSELVHKKVGVFIGDCSPSDEKSEPDLLSVVGHNQSGLANRISHRYKFLGPSFTIDTDRSASLVALHLAFQSLNSGESDLALVGGINLIESYESYQPFIRGNMISKSGQCRFGDDRADGFVRSEGAAFVVLQRTGDIGFEYSRQYCRIIGTATQFGAFDSMSMVQPSVKGQERIIESVLATSGVQAKDICYFEAHGTGTPVGDKVEISALKNIFENHKVVGSPLFIGSVKTNIGHCEGVAGLAGLIKVALACYHGYMPSSLHFRNKNSQIDYDENKVKILNLGMALDDEHRFFGVSSFGLTGSLAQVICERPRILNKELKKNITIINLVLSFNDDSNLSDIAHRHSEFISKLTNSNEIYAYCYALYKGRDRLKYTLHLCANSKEYLLEQLNDVVANSAKYVRLTDSIDFKSIESQFIQTTRIVSTASILADETPHMVGKTSDTQENLVNPGVLDELIKYELGEQKFALLLEGQSFNEIGINSAMAVELRNKISEKLKITLSIGVLYDYPTLNELRAFLAKKKLHKGMNIGTVLLRRGAIDENQLISAIEFQKNNASGEKLGSILMRLGHLTPDDLNRGLKEMASQSIAIVGMGCKLPGGIEHPDEFWRRLTEGYDFVTEVPSDRWDVNDYYDKNIEVPGKTITKWGSFINDVKSFDPAFFSIANAEAHLMDPRQRIALEVTWRALEHAAISPNELIGSKTGVFMGAMEGDDYGQLKLISRDVTAIAAHDTSGSEPSIISGRIAYFLGLRGPTITVDTACSSSLVSVHLAAQSLRTEESKLAIAGGINLILLPHGSIAYSKSRMMSADGRCKTFDESANGYVRGEGCGVVILKRLNDAIRDGNKIFAILSGTGVGHNGRTSGLTVPSGPSQTDLFQQVLSDAGISAKNVCYVEAHGTGTELGDPIELNAIADAYVRNTNRQDSLYVGSVKTNVGHLEAAAGVVGLIKSVYVVKEKFIPKNIHLQNVTSNLPHCSPEIMIPDKGIQLPKDKEICIGISSFGFGGTNAHAILSSAPERKNLNFTRRESCIFTINANSLSAFERLKNDTVQYLSENPNLSLESVCRTSNLGRGHLRFRSAIEVNSVQDLVAKLKVAQAQLNMKGDVSQKVCFMFTGQGTQYLKMAEGLFRSCSFFRDQVNECAKLLMKHSSIDLINLIYGNSSSAVEINKTIHAQPAIFAIEYSLGMLMKHYGIKPYGVFGHSIGEIAAATLTGIMDLESAIRLVAMRGSLMQSLPTSGSMCAVLGVTEEVESIIAPYTQVSLAAYNSPTNRVISGDSSQVQELTNIFTQRGLEVVPLNVSHAFHSPLMQPIYDQFLKFAETLSFEKPKVSFYSTFYGCEVSEQKRIDAKYWADHIVGPVRFKQIVNHLASDIGLNRMLEIGPRPTLCKLLRQFSDIKTKTFHLLEDSQPNWTTLSKSLAALYDLGANPDWAHFHEDFDEATANLPLYPFERKDFWIKTKGAPTPNPQRDVVSLVETNLNKESKWKNMFADKIDKMQESEVAYNLLKYRKVS